MNKVIVGVVSSGLLGAALGASLMTVSAVAERQETHFTGTVQRVWEDGLRLKAGDRTLIVDTWDLCGDHTAQYLATSATITVTGEFDRNEFDAVSLVDTDGISVCG